MSLGIAFKGPEGIVLAADSRVTLTAEMQRGPEKMMLPAAYDNSQKLLRVSCQKHVGVVTYGMGAIGQREPRTAHSFLPEFEDQLNKDGNEQLSVEVFARRLGVFFLDRWQSEMPASGGMNDMTFLVGGFDPGAPYGRVFRVSIPSTAQPVEQNPDKFGLTWGGQLEYVSRILKGFDPGLPEMVQRHLGLSDQDREGMREHLEGQLSAKIPYQFLPLQDCVDLSIFLIRTTMEIQKWMIGVRGVGGAIDVATITRTEGFKPVQQKEIVGQAQPRVS